MNLVLDETTFAAWLNAYKAAWESRDPNAAAGLFTADASYHEMPFDAPIVGADAIAAYWAKAVAGQRDVRFTSEILACTEDQGVCHWRCSFTGVPDGENIDLDGIFRCRFSALGRVAHFQEWWHIRIVQRDTPIGV